MSVPAGKFESKYCSECKSPMQYALATHTYKCLNECETRVSDVAPNQYDALNAFSVDFHNEARKRGFYSDVPTGAPIERNAGEQLMLMVSEIAEMMEGVRKNKMDDHLPHRKSVEVEAADLAIRLFDFCGYHKLDLAGAVYEKAAYNRIRADHDPKNRAKPDGKKF